MVELREEHYRHLEKRAKENNVTMSEMMGRIIRVFGYLDDMYDLLSAKIDLSPEDFDAFMIRVQEREDIIWARLRARAESNLDRNK